jgi:seryl-tRNA synthetase
VAFSHCFRKEAGHGKESRGLYRLHQFSKVEMFATTTPDQSDKVLLEMVDIQQEVMELLQIPYRVLNMATEELGAAAYRKFDIEAWMPGRQIWGEVSSASNCTSY